MRQSHPRSQDLQSTPRFAKYYVANHGQEDGISESLPEWVDWLFIYSYLKIWKIDIKRTLDTTFLNCLALNFCDVKGHLLLEWACRTDQGGTTFPLTSNFVNIPVSRVRMRLSGKWSSRVASLNRVFVFFVFFRCSFHIVVSSRWCRQPGEAAWWFSSTHSECGT